MNAGLKIKKLREFKNLTQEYMAGRLEVSQSYYNRIENGQVNLTLERIQAIATILDIEPLALLAFDEVQYFHQVSNSQIGSGQYVHQVYSEEERSLYRQQIARLEQEVNYLRQLIDRLGQLDNG